VFKGTPRCGLFGLLNAG